MTRKPKRQPKRKPKPYLIGGLPAEFILHLFCDIHLASTDWTHSPPNPELLRELMRWYSANIPREPWSPEQQAMMVDYLALLVTPYRAYRIVGDWMGLPPKSKSVERNHERHGTPPAVLAVRRAALHERLRKNGRPLPSRKSVFLPVLLHSMMVKP